MSHITSDQFDIFMARSFGDALLDVEFIAVGVSGGADSMALLYLLQGWCERQGKVLHVLSVDHQLREAAKAECEAVVHYCEAFAHVVHKTLVWDVPSDVRLQEEARKARYDLMSGYCQQHGIVHLFLAHHEDDQAETVLFRLAKGSGLDGLAGMREVQDYADVVLCRPLLSVAKEALVATCAQNDIPYIDDPSNENEVFARVRLRRSMDVLAEEGLSSKRLSVTAARMARAREALDVMAERAEETYGILKNTNRIEFASGLLLEPLEIIIRVIMNVIDTIGLDRDYAPRMEKVEALVFDLVHDLSFRKRTLGGVVFERDDDNKRVILTRENSDV